MRAEVDKEELKRFVEKQDMPFTVSDVANTLHINWATARVILLELALNGYVKAVKTSKSYVFLPAKSHSVLAER